MSALPVARSRGYSSLIRMVMGKWSKCCDCSRHGPDRGAVRISRLTGQVPAKLATSPVADSVQLYALVEELRQVCERRSVATAASRLSRMRYKILP
jgi:hypothetical protein